MSCLLVVLTALPSPAQEVAAPAEAAPRTLNRWGVEVETIQPFLPTIHIARVRAGVLAGRGVANIGPRGGKPDTFLQGNLLIGLSC